jgi:hypothetical protein
MMAPKRRCDILYAPNKSFAPLVELDHATALQHTLAFVVLGKAKQMKI